MMMMMMMMMMMILTFLFYYTNEAEWVIDHVKVGKLAKVTDVIKVRRDFPVQAVSYIDTHS